MPASISQLSALGTGSVSMTAAADKAFAARRAKDTPKEFEAFVLQSFIQEMLPKTANDVYGSGIAGDIWRSMLSEKLAYQVAERGGIGIADQVRSSRGLDGAGLPAATGAADAPAETQAQDTSAEQVSAGDGGSGWRVTIERS